MKYSLLVGAFLFSFLLVCCYIIGILLFCENGIVCSFSSKKIGIIEINGNISTSDNILRSIEDFRYNNLIKAIILRVESPGGAVGASQEIYREIVKTTAIKPVICSMGCIAASGGYYVSSPCSVIVANPGTLTGSIGVLTTIPDASELCKKIGIKLQTFTSGKAKAIGQIDRPITSVEEKMIKILLVENHRQFVLDIALGRNLPLETIRKISDGRVITGIQAKKIGLVDEIGNFNDAVQLATKLAFINGKPELITLKECKKNLIDIFLKKQYMSDISNFIFETFMITKYLSYSIY